MRKIDVVIRNPYERVVKELTKDEIRGDTRIHGVAQNTRVFELERKIPDPTNKGKLIKDEKVLVKQVDLYTVCENCDGKGNLNGVDDCEFCDAEVRGFNHYKSFYDLV